MSRHIFKPEKNIQIHMGYDKPMGSCYCSIIKILPNNEEEFIYDDTNDGDIPIVTRSFQFSVMDQLKHFQKKINECNPKWTLPDQVILNVYNDAFEQKVSQPPVVYESWKLLILKKDCKPWSDVEISIPEKLRIIQKESKTFLD